MPTIESQRSEPSSDSVEALSSVLNDDLYLRRRMNPPLTDLDYLIFKDLLPVIRRFAESVEGHLLDYGSGGAPYRSLFRALTRYEAADVTPGPHVTLTLRSDGSVPVFEGTFDAVLSTQVLEHVPDPGAYLREGLRVLKPGGRMLVTTHGLFIEHGCPDDFRRWTAKGLEWEAKAAGFEILRASKIVAGPRGSFHLMHYCVAELIQTERPQVHALLTVVRKLYCWFALPALNWLGDFFTNMSEVPADHRTPVFSGVMVELRKPNAAI